MQAEVIPDLDVAPTGLVVTADAGVVRVLLDNGDQNRVSPDMVAWLTAVLDVPPAWCRIVLIASTGPSFCLGPVPASAPERVRDLGEALAGFNEALTSTRVVTIAAIDGVAAGFGVGLASLPDITIAGTDARWVLPEVKVGLTPALVLSWLVDLIGPKAATFMALTGIEVGVERALDLGLASQVAESGSLNDEVDTLIGRLSSFDSDGLLEVKRYLVDRRGKVPREAVDLAIERMGDWAVRDR